LTATRFKGEECNKMKKKQQVPAPVVTTSVTMECRSTIAVFTVQGASDNDLYQAKQKLVARGIQCDIVNLGDGKLALSVPIKTVKERGGDFLEEVQSFLRGFSRTVSSPA